MFLSLRLSSAYTREILIYPLLLAAKNGGHDSNTKTRLWNEWRTKQKKRTNDNTHTHKKLGKRKRKIWNAYLSYYIIREHKI